MSTPQPKSSDFLDPLVDYINTKTPAAIQSHFQELLRTTHRLLGYAQRQLFWTRLVAIVLGVMYLTK